jgi:hypothetical protein
MSLEFIWFRFPCPLKGSSGLPSREDLWFLRANKEKTGVLARAARRLKKPSHLFHATAPWLLFVFFFFWQRAFLLLFFSGVQEAVTYEH